MKRFMKKVDDMEIHAEGIARSGSTQVAPPIVTRQIMRIGDDIFHEIAICQSKIAHGKGDLPSDNLWIKTPP